MISDADLAEEAFYAVREHIGPAAASLRAWRGHVYRVTDPDSGCAPVVVLVDAGQVNPSRYRVLNPGLEGEHVTYVGRSSDQRMP